MGRCEIAINHPILSEYEEVIARLAMRYPEKKSTDWLGPIRRAGHLYYPTLLPAHTADPDDEMFIECAVAARADRIVTGDKGHLLSLREADGIPIISASEFLRLLGTSDCPP